MRSKEAKGYRMIEVDDGFNFATNTARVNGRSKKTDLSKINDKVLKLIGKLYNSATDYLVRSIDTPLGKLSANQVGHGVRILNEIEYLLDLGYKGYRYELLSNEFYSHIPVIFGNKVNYNKFIIDSYDK